MVKKKQEQEIETVDNKEIEQKYPRELLLLSQTVNSFGLHRDVVGAILVKPEYTIQEAKNSIEKYIKSFDSKGE